MSLGNVIKKTIRYGRKNGWKPALYTAMERVKQQRDMPYVYEAVSERELEEQRKHNFGKRHKISILVPTYETKPLFLKALIDSVLAQSYSEWELILADASASSIVRETVGEYQDDRIRYCRLSHNGGISANTNQAMQFATGTYCAMLDHDDMLTPNALYEMAIAIEKLSTQEVMPAFLYSDEDKCDAEAKAYFEPHYKMDFNEELLLTNNYICHFLVVETQLLKKTGFRNEYDGAQDFDLVLRLVKAVRAQYGISTDWQSHIVHIPKVLYHWRCHLHSTAENPESKMYAYEAGKRALEDYYDACHIQAKVKHGMHLGFYRTEYQMADDIFTQREEIGAIGGLLVRHRKIAGGAYYEDGMALYEGIFQFFAGYMNRLHLMQDVDAIDIRCIRISPRWESLYQEIIGIPYVNTLPEDVLPDGMGIQIKRLSPQNPFSDWTEADIRRKSIAFSKAVRANGGKIVLNPLYRREIT